ncbi:hypothetical protein, partial [Methylorubrum thiocyanatum]
MTHPFDALEAELAQAAAGYGQRRDRAPLDHGVKAIKALLAHPEWTAQSDERRCTLLNQGAGLLLQRFKTGGE